MADAPMMLHAIEAGQGDPPLVLLHGLFGSARNFATIQKTFAPQRRTIALDMRNHGASPHAHDMRYATMASDVLHTLEHLDALPAILLGHSLGGKAAMQTALMRPDAVARLIVADIAPVPYPSHLRPTAHAMASLTLAPGMTRAQADAALAGAIPDRGMRAFLLQNLQPGAAPGWRIGLSEIIAGFADIEAWDVADDARYAGPTLFIVGETSNYVQSAHRPLIRTLFPRARFVTLKNAGHWLHAENPAGFIAIVEAFLTPAS
jgi:esterase